jgi:hypothetical protein
MPTVFVAGDLFGGCHVMVNRKTLDLFITHAWRYHDDWKRAVDMLNAYGLHRWRNFSLPWYDPALDPRTEKGGQIVRWNLESQIIPAHAVILLTSVLEEPGCRKWLDFELEMSRKHNKPVFALPAWGKADVAAEIRERVQEVVAWDAAALIAAVESHRNASETAPAASAA